MAYKLLINRILIDSTQGETDETMFQMQRIIKKIKGIRLKPGSKRTDRTNKNCPVPIDEIGYEASSLLSQTEHMKKNRQK